MTRLTPCKESFVCNCWVCCHDDKQSTPSAWHTFLCWRIVWRGCTSLLSNSASRSGPCLPDAPCAVLLPQGRRLVFSPTGKCTTKKKGNKKKRKEKHFVQSGLKILGQKVNDFWTKNSSSISFPLRFFWACWGVDEPQAGLCLVFVPWQALPAPGDTSTFLVGDLKTAL